jgi:hypothetical protein
VTPDEAMTGEPWPPSWFDSIRADQTDTAERTEEILATEFGGQVGGMTLTRKGPQS